MRYLLIALVIIWTVQMSYGQKYDIQVHAEFNVGTTLGQLRAVPVQCGKNTQPNVLLVYSEDKEIDPFRKMFFFPTNSMKFAMYTADGELVWKKSLNKGNIPGVWFLPVFPFDLDQDGKEEIWFVHNTDEDHPFDVGKYKLTRLNPDTGEITGEFPWHGLEGDDLTMSFRYRHFIFGGYHHGQPVLVTAQGTYSRMQLQGWNPDMSQRWDLKIGKDEKGSRGSHSTVVVDIDMDGSDEFFYGERCINIATGKYKFIADENVWNGHSDVVLPVMNYDENKWYLYTTRESGTGIHPPRVVMYKNDGRRLWTDLEEGHMDMGWVARIGDQGKLMAMAVRIGDKKAGPEGFYRSSVEEFLWEPFTGKPIKKDMVLYEHFPVDINGDGIHELIGSGNVTDGKLRTNQGKEIMNFGADAMVAILSKFLDKDGEQLLLYYPDGTIKIVFDKNAKDNATALKRYQHPFYKINQKQTAQGYSLNLLGGI
jgi:hypothetical protein